MAKSGKGDVKVKMRQKVKHKEKNDDQMKNLVESGQKAMKNKKRSDRYSNRQKHREIQPDVRGKKDLPRGKRWFNKVKISLKK